METNDPNHLVIMQSYLLFANSTNDVLNEFIRILSILAKILTASSGSVQITTDDIINRQNDTSNIPVNIMEQWIINENKDLKLIVLERMPSCASDIKLYITFLRQMKCFMFI